MDTNSLSCIICSKKPQFSDISHLLTHISSKAHLANYFKLQVRSHHHSTSNETLTQYDKWYEENDLAKLLSDRMNSASRTTRRRRSSRSFEIEFDTSSQLSFQTGDDKIDPRLSASQQLLTSSDNIKSEVLSSCDLYERPVSKVREESPRWPEYPSTNHGVGLTKRKNETIGKTHKYNPFMLNVCPKTPTSRSGNGQFAAPGLENVEEAKIEEFSRLKGVHWPGMDVFDAASDAMKRRRNQKKDARTFKAMEAASCATEPNEMVFSPSGSLRREREITGFVEEEDLLPGEWSIPKTRRERRERRDLNNREHFIARSGHGSQRIALSVTDPNRSVLGSRIVKREHQQNQKLPEDQQRRKNSLYTAFPRSHRHGVSHSHFNAANDDDVELQLSVGISGRNKASRIHVFKDDDSAKAEQKLDSPVPDSVEERTIPDEPPYLPNHQQSGDTVPNLLGVDDPAKLSPMTNNIGLLTEHSYSYSHTSAPQELSRRTEGIYLVDNSLGSAYRVPYDPLVGGNVLHYRWDWNAPDPVLDANMFYNRAVSSDTAIYQDENESKSCLWLDGYGR